MLADVMIARVGFIVDARFAELPLDRVHLRLNGCGVAFEFAQKIGNVVFRHALDDQTNCLGEVFELPIAERMRTRDVKSMGVRVAR